MAPAPLYGRDQECTLIDRLVADARDGRSGVLVVRGEMGAGKSALLDYAGTSGTGLRVLRCSGAQTETELAFAALHQLLRPLLGELDDLAQPQAAAVRGAFGLADAAPVDRFQVFLGALTLLSEAADEEPLLCLIDDAQWLDQPSADAIAFVARRLAAERVAVLIAVRDEPVFVASGLPEVRLRGLDRAAANALVTDRYPELTAEIKDRVIAECGGNPLALAVLPAALTPGQRAGRGPLLGPLPLPEHLHQLYLDQVRGLPDTTRTLLLVAAAEHSGELAVIFAAARDLGAPPGALDAAEQAGLVGIDSRNPDQVVVFRHPLVRSAVYQGATHTARLAAHHSLAKALERGPDADRRAWHLAAAATGPDERFAVELEQAGDRAIRRGGAAAGAYALERAAWLTVDPTLRAERLARAAEAANDAGGSDQAEALARHAEQAGAGPVGRARISRLRAAIHFERGYPATAHRLLLADASVVAADEPELAASMLVDAVKNGWFMNDRARTRRAVESLAEVRLPAGSGLGSLVGTAIDLGGRVVGATEPPGRGVGSPANATAREASDPLAAVLRAVADAVVGDDDLAAATMETAVAECRTDGRLGWLPLTLQLLASIEMLVGRHAFARANAAEGLELAGLLGHDNHVCHLSCVLAWLDAVAGEEHQCHDLASRALRHAEARRSVSSAAIATWGLGLLDLGLGRPDDAFQRLRSLSSEHPLVGLRQTPDLVEAATRAGYGDLAAPQARTFERGPRTRARPGRRPRRPAAERCCPSRVPSIPARRWTATSPTPCAGTARPTQRDGRVRSTGPAPS